MVKKIKKAPFFGVGHQIQEIQKEFWKMIVKMLILLKCFY